MPVSAETLQRFKRASSATLTTQLFKRGLRNVYIQGVHRMSLPGGNMVGEAFTLRYIPAREDLDHVGVFENPEHPQRKAIEVAPPGQVLVMDCRRDARAASGGSILLTRLRVRGVAGVVTDGGMRDSDTIAGIAFPVYGAGGSPPLNLAIHHAVDLNVPIGCGGVAVFPGDVIVGDAEGVVVVPAHLADEVARDAAEQDILEEFVLQEVADGRPLVGTYPPNADTIGRYKIWRTQRDKKIT
ncbi:MAG: ribonuclease activity regulator RraA [Casimicrobiaceae bacterium]